MTTLDEISALTRPNHPDDWTELDSAAVDTIRVLAADAVHKVGNGHPGTAMSLAPLAYTLFQRQMRHDPSDTHWLGRDRFVLSAGHSSLTLYIQLYLGGFGLELADIEALRTWGSKTPGHPEFRHTTGVEITTGPLGQGLASAVGMAMASRYERGLFDPDAAPGTSPFDHYIYVIASDGDMEEGVTSEASSLAGTQQLGNLIVFCDNNEISIEDDTNIAFTEDTPARYRGVRLARTGGRGRRERRRHRGGHRGGQGRHRQAVVHRGSHHHRLPGPDQDEHRQGARLGSRRRGSRRRQEDSRIRPGEDVRGARRGHRAHPQAGRPRQGSPREVAGRLRRVGGARTRAQEAARPPAGPGTARRLGCRHPALGAGLEGAGHPRGVRRGPQRGRAEAARTLGRVCGPGRQQQHHHQGRQVVRATVDLDQGVHGGLVWPRAAFRCPRARAWARSCPASCCTARLAPSAARSCSSPTTCARRCGWRR